MSDRRISNAQLRRDLDLAMRDIKLLTGLLHIVGIGTQYCLKDSSFGADYTYSAAVSAKLNATGVVTGIPTRKPSVFAIPSLIDLWDAVFSTTSWKDL